MTKAHISTARSSHLAATVLIGALAFLVTGPVARAETAASVSTGINTAAGASVTQRAGSLVPKASTTTSAKPAAEDTSIRPFHFHATDAALADLRRRIAETKWPNPETVKDASQGVQYTTMRKLADYWQKDYDWRRIEARLDALPQFKTTIGGLEIHFIHIRSKHKKALPLIITHGWPGSIVEQLKVIDPLTNPTAYGGREDDAFDVVIPSLPGHGFSEQPTETGWDPVRIARAWNVLMKRLGYTHYVAQGGDWGDAVSEQMALQAPPELLGIHTNMPATVPDDIAEALQLGNPPPAGLSAEEKHAFDQLDYFYKHGLAYAQEMSNVDARSRHPQLRAHLPGFRWQAGGPDARRHPRQHHALLADQYCGFVGSPVLGKQAGFL